MEKEKSDNEFPSFDGEWLFSDNFLKRAFAIWGYCMMAQLIVVAGIYVVVGLLILIS